MARFKCPNVHKLTVANKIKAGSNIFVQYSCRCNDRYIFAPGLKKEKLQPKNRIYKTINLSYNISKLDDGYNQINDIIKYKFFGEKK